MTFRALFADAERGELGPMDRLRTEGAGVPERAGWRACGDALSWLARGGTPHDWPVLAAGAEGAAEAQALHARAALLRFDEAALARVLAWRSPPRQGPGWAELALLWGEAASGACPHVLARGVEPRPFQRERREKSR